jgi:arginyl-tRNA synthetase
MQFNLHNHVKKNLAKAIQSAIKSEYDTEIALIEIYNLISRPPKLENGDICYGCFKLAKELKQAPPQIANTLNEKISADFIQASSAMGPYINFHLKPEIFLKEHNLKGNLIQSAEKTMIEFSQPNTHKELHVGHMRNLCLGDALIKIHRYAGVDTIATTFPGDVGTHVAKCLWYYTHHTDQKIPNEDRKGAWLGTLYTKGNNLLEDEKGTDKEAKNREELTKILKEIHAQEGDYYELWKETRQWSIHLMEEVYKWADVDFDIWYWESTVDSDSVKLINEYYEKGLFVKDDGAIGIDLSDDKLGFCLLLKSDGTGLYATKDVELARRKFEDLHVEKSIYVVDNRQALHFKQVFKTLEKMGFENAKNCYHLQYEMVELTDGAMSSRKGNIVPLQDLIDKMQETIIKNYLAKYEKEWAADEIQNTAKEIAKGAIKFGMNRIDPNKKIVFDMDEWLRLDGESGPYIQYVYARIQSMLAKVEDELDQIDLNQLTSSYEKSVLYEVSQFNDIVENTLKNYKTNLLCNYLYDLAKAYNQFYANCPILKAQNKELLKARAYLSQTVAETLSAGLALLGIRCPKRM